MSTDWGAIVGGGLGTLLGGPIGLIGGSLLGSTVGQGLGGSGSWGDSVGKTVNGAFNGSYQTLGSPNDVTLINKGSYNDYLNKIYGGINEYSGSMGGNISDAAQNYQNVMNTAQGYQNILNQAYGSQKALNGSADRYLDMMGSQGNQSAGQLANMSGMAGNLNNYAKQMQTQGSSMWNIASDPNAAVNQYMSMNPQLAQIANQNISGALSDVYSTGRAQAEAAGAEARRQAATQLANAGLLNSGAAVNAMTQATANPVLTMESNLANTRAQAYQNQLAGLQGQAGSLIGSGYQNALQGALQSSQLGLQANELAGNLYGNAASGYQNLASLYGQAGLNQQNMAQGYANLGLNAQQGQTAAYATAGQGYQNSANTYAALLGQLYGAGTQLNEPYYYSPQYAHNPGLLSYLSGAGQAAAGLAPLIATMV